MSVEPTVDYSDLFGPSSSQSQSFALSGSAGTASASTVGAELVVRSGFKETQPAFLEALKGLRAHGLTPLGPALRLVLDYLNLNRAQSGIDNYGYVCCGLSHSVFFCIFHSVLGF